MEIELKSPKYRVKSIKKKTGAAGWKHLRPEYAFQIFDPVSNSYNEFGKVLQLHYVVVVYNKEGENIESFVTSCRELCRYLGYFELETVE